MHRADFMKLLDELWPKNQLPDAVIRALGERVERLPLDDAQVRANLTEYRIHCPKYEVTTPSAGTIEKRLRVLAYPPETAKPSGGSSEMRDREPPPGGFVTGSDFREWAKANGIPVHIGKGVGK